tara:strand:+ start:738 stop:968 length:231 start_codon:yes stop_codon:yes gene_type:complete
MLNENRAITLGRLQVEFECLYTDKGLSIKELRSMLLKRCSQEELNSNSFEYLAKYLTQKLITNNKKHPINNEELTP